MFDQNEILMAAIRWWARPSSQILVVCDHASNWFPPSQGTLGLDETTRSSHDAWDLGALSLALSLAQRLNADVLAPSVSRLVVDCNRPPTSPYLIATEANEQPILENTALSPEAVERRLINYHEPYHCAIDTWLGSHPHARALISVHSFTPELKGEVRSWLCGLLHEGDPFALDVLQRLGLVLGDYVGDNQPYGPDPLFDYTIPTHTQSRKLASLLIEVRNDQLHDLESIDVWADRLASVINDSLAVYAPV